MGLGKCRFVGAMSALLFGSVACGSGSETLGSKPSDDGSDASAGSGGTGGGGAGTGGNGGGSAGTGGGSAGSSGSAGAGGTGLVCKQHTQDISTGVAIGSEGMYFATYRDRLLASWRAVSGGSPDQYGLVSEFKLSPEGAFTPVQELDFGKQCENVGGMAASSDGSLIAVLCQGSTNTYGHMEDSTGASPTARPAALANFFPGAGFFNLLALRGTTGFYVGDIFTSTSTGRDLFVLEFTNGLDNTPDKVIFVSSASSGQAYGHLNISLDREDEGHELYYISNKARSNPDSSGKVHTDMKEIGLRRNTDGTYSRLRLTDNYGTGLGVTHPDFAKVAYNKTLSKWGRLSHGDEKTSWATIPDYLASSKGNQNPPDNIYQEFPFEGITERQPLSIISLAAEGFMALASRNGSVGVKKLTATVPELTSQDWEWLSLSDRGFANIAHFSTDADKGSHHLIGWSPADDVYKVQVIDKRMILLGEPLTLENDARWGNGDWGFMRESGCVVFAHRKITTTMQLTSLCPQGS